MPVQIPFVLKAIQPLKYSPYTLMRGWHRQVKTWLAPWLAPESTRQIFSLSPLLCNADGLYSGQVIWLPEEGLDAASALWDKMNLASQTQLPLDLNYQPLIIAGVGDAQMLKREELFQSVDIQPRLKLRFVSPTALGSGKTAPVETGSGLWRPGIQRAAEGYLLPDPFRIFHTLLYHWNSFADFRCFPHGVLQALDQSVELQACQIETEKVILGYAQRKPMYFQGFKGEIELYCHSRDADILRIFQTLGHYAALSGIGRKTAMGMGFVRLG